MIFTQYAYTNFIPTTSHLSLCWVISELNYLRHVVMQHKITSQTVRIIDCSAANTHFVQHRKRMESLIAFVGEDEMVVHQPIHDLGIPTRDPHSKHLVEFPCHCFCVLRHLMAMKCSSVSFGLKDGSIKIVPLRSMLNRGNTQEESTRDNGGTYGNRETTRASAPASLFQIALYWLNLYYFWCMQYFLETKL